MIHIQAAFPEQLDVGKSVRESVSRLLHGRGARFGNVVAADRDRIPTRHVRGSELDHVSEKAHRGLDGENDLILRLYFLKDVGLNGAA